MDIISLWNKVLQLIKGELSPPSFNAFFKQLVPLKITNDNIIILAPNEFTKSILEDRYLNLIESSIDQVSSKKYIVKFILESDDKKDNKVNNNILNDCEGIVSNNTSR